MKYLKFIAKHTLLFYLVSFTWGFIASFIGLLIMIPFLITGKVRSWNKRIYGVFPKSFGSGWGFEMGCFYFTSYDCENIDSLRYHEMGHGLQNLIFGPLQLFISTIPSIIRFWYRDLKYERKGLTPPTKYDDIWFEETATNWGKYVYGNIKIPTKYAYIVINQKIMSDDPFDIEYRRVLISYKRKRINGNVLTYKGTKIIDVDKYFKSKQANLKYFFADKYYYIEEVKTPEIYGEELTKRMLNVKREYHCYLNYGKKPIEFSVCSDSEARKYLQNIK